MAIKTFEDYKKEYFSKDADGLLAVKTPCFHHPGYRLTPPDADDFEQIWDFWVERTEKKQMLISELDNLLEEPIAMLSEQISGATDPDATELGNQLNRICKILIALKG